MNALARKMPAPDWQSNEFLAAEADGHWRIAAWDGRKFYDLCAGKVLEPVVVLRLPESAAVASRQRHHRRHQRRGAGR